MAQLCPPLQLRVEVATVWIPMTFAHPKNRAARNRAFIFILFQLMNAVGLARGFMLRRGAEAKA